MTDTDETKRMADIQEYRRERLGGLVERLGSQAQAARTLQLSRAMLSAMMLGKRNISDRVAHGVEVLRERLDGGIGGGTPGGMAFELDEAVHAATTLLRAVVDRDLDIAQMMGAVLQAQVLRLRDLVRDAEAADDLQSRTGLAAAVIEVFGGYERAKTADG